MSGQQVGFYAIAAQTVATVTAMQALDDSTFKNGDIIYVQSGDYPGPYRFYLSLNTAANGTTIYSSLNGRGKYQFDDDLGMMSITSTGYLGQAPFKFYVLNFPGDTDVVNVADTNILSTSKIIPWYSTVVSADPGFLYGVPVAGVGFSVTCSEATVESDVSVLVIY